MKRYLSLLILVLLLLYSCTKNVVTSTINQPTEIPTETLTGNLSSGSIHTMILKKDGTLWATGNNYYGQLGTGDTTNISTPKQVMSEVSSVSSGSGHTMILKKDGTLWATGDNSSGQLGTGDTVDVLTPKQINF